MKKKNLKCKTINGNNLPGKKEAAKRVFYEIAEFLHKSVKVVQIVLALK